MRFVTVNLSCVEREMERERAAAPGLAVDPHEAAMSAHDVVDDGEPEAGALRSRSGVGLHTIELAEDLALQPQRHADAAVGNPYDAVASVAIDVDGDFAMLGRILHRVRDQV